MKAMKRRYLLTVCTLCASLNLTAQTGGGGVDSIYVYGRVVDSFTYELLKGVRVEVMHADSSPITELVTDARFLFDGNEANVARVGGLTLPRERKLSFAIPNQVTRRNPSHST